MKLFEEYFEVTMLVLMGVLIIGGFFLFTTIDNNKEVKIVNVEYLDAVEDEKATIVNKRRKHVNKQIKRYFYLEFKDGFEKRVKVRSSEYNSHEIGNKYVASHDSNLLVSLVTDKGQNDTIEVSNVSKDNVEILNKVKGKTMKKKEIKELIK